MARRITDISLSKEFSDFEDEVDVDCMSFRLMKNLQIDGKLSEFSRNSGLNLKYAYLKNLHINGKSKGSARRSSLNLQYSNENLAMTKLEGVKRVVSDHADERKSTYDSLYKRDSRKTVIIDDNYSRHFSNYAFSNTKMAAIRYPSLYETALTFVEDVINKSLRKTDVSKISEPPLLRRVFPNTCKTKVNDPLLFQTAKSVVDNILDECDKRITNLRLINIERFFSYKEPSDFKIRDGLEIVARCLHSWPFNPYWYVKVIYNGRSYEDDCHVHYYIARLSVPTPAYPVAQVTADLYFTVEVRRQTHGPLHVQVWYSVETDRSRKCALRSVFREKWIRLLVTTKLQMFKRFTF